MAVKTTKIEKRWKDKKTGEQKSMTINYAKVADRIKEFRESCPNGKFETTIEIKGNYIFAKAFVKADLNKASSAEATGHAIAKLTGSDKEFEKLETLAVGRGLAFIGYAAGGEVASSEEMAEFLDYQETKKEDAITALEDCETLDELKKVFMSLGNLMSDKKIIEVKNNLKTKLK